MQRRFTQIDVFSSTPYRGNPVAVVVDCDGLSDEEMQQFARWTNLSETTFLLPPTSTAADYRVRFFTPTEELTFAGHPTLGSAYAWLIHGGSPRSINTIVQECEVGLINVHRDGSSLSFAAPSLLRGGAVEESLLAEAATSLGIHRDAIIDSAWIDNGPGWLGIQLGSAEQVLAIKPQKTNLTLGIVGAYPAGSRFAYEVRAFYSSGGVTVEDPVTGSLNASLAQWLIGEGRFVPPYLASQGLAMGHAGEVQVSMDESKQVWIGGVVTACIQGTVEM
ncbi:MAG: PhzF family phenazine biosynthesis protein [Ilumatobacteraceae bacterium]|nr:PhzF family phenazine biosynthesis protein [Ilumatobacteraceae bacterium]